LLFQPSLHRSTSFISNIVHSSLHIFWILPTIFLYYSIITYPILPYSAILTACKHRHFTSLNGNFQALQAPKIPYYSTTQQRYFPTLQQQTNLTIFGVPSADNRARHEVVNGLQHTLAVVSLSVLRGIFPRTSRHHSGSNLQEHCWRICFL
jgi:hypothetical protein